MESTRPATLRSRRICRFCLVENDSLTFIHDREVGRSFQVPLPLQIMSCVSVEVYSADGMPQMVCSNCRSNLDRCYRFKQQCKKADEALRAYPTSGVLPRPFAPITDNIETGNKRPASSTNDSSKKARLDNGERQVVQRQIEIKQSQSQQQQQQQQQQQDHQEIYEEDQEISEGEQEMNSTQENLKLEPGEIRVHACNLCDRTFPLLQSLQVHKLTSHRDRNFKCTECDRMFFSKYDLNKHMATHAEDKPYSCQICNKSFTRANLLQRHEKMHRDELRYGCAHCDREFFTTEELEKHEEAAHNSVKPFQCNICNKRFTYKQGLERHEMLHNEDKSFSCEYCKEAFRTSTKLARHLQTHAGHRPYLCKQCPRTFLLSHHLTRHMRTHDIEKTHQCEECDKSFKRKESLEVHQLTHMKRTGMALTCDVCGESCRNRADYVTHIKQHIEAGEKMGPDGLSSSKDKTGETDTEEEEEEEEEEEAYSDGDDDYKPPYAVKRNVQKTLKRDGDDVEDRVVYVRSKDGSMVKKTIKTLMPITRRSEAHVNQQQVKQQVSSSQLVKQSKQEDIQQKVDQVKETVTVKQSSSQPATPQIIKEEKLDPATITLGKNARVIKRIIVRKPLGDGGVITGPIRDLVPDPPAQAPAPVASATAAPVKSTKRVIVRRIIRQGDTMREVIMNPDGTVIDPAELAKLPTGNVVKRVVVKKPRDKVGNIEQMLQNVDAKRIISLAERVEDMANNQSSTTVQQISKIETRVQAKQQLLKQQQKQQLQLQQKQKAIEDHDTKQKLEQLEKRVEQQRLKIEELQARKQQEYEGDDMLPERHDESEDEQQLPLKRVFVKRNKSIYDEEREYSDDKEQSESNDHQKRQISRQASKEEDENQEQEHEPEPEPEPEQVSSSPLDDSKCAEMKAEEYDQEEEMGRELCTILESTDAVSKMQENVLNNLQEITQVDTTQGQIEVCAEEQKVEDTSVVSAAEEEPEEQMDISTGENEQDREQVEVEMNGQQQEDGTILVITQPDGAEVKIQLQEQEQQGADLTEVQDDDGNIIFGNSDAGMETEKNENDQSQLQGAVITLSSNNENIRHTEHDDSSRDSLEAKLSQMEG
ncbi:hypothetical protein TKK_0017325 [Trichogramma kaykai]|uniref:Protein krueppel n=1 Tax=Trichogramma kaykai TaxID=54128 RepID=A0ABD2W2E6_9HYME